MSLCTESMGLDHVIHTNVLTHSKQSCSASISCCNPSDTLQRLLLLVSSSTSLILLSSSSCNWIWIKMAFPFLLFSSLLWLKRDLPGEITRMQRYSYTTNCSTETLHLWEQTYFLTKITHFSSCTVKWLLEVDNLFCSFSFSFF